MTTITVPISEFKANISRYLAGIEGKRIRITRNGDEIATVTSRRDEKREAIKSLEGILEGSELAGLDKRQIRDMRLKEKYGL